MLLAIPLFIMAVVDGTRQKAKSLIDFVELLLGE